jgi:hypothetical protein
MHRWVKPLKYFGNFHENYIHKMIMVKMILFMLDYFLRFVGIQAGIDENNSKCRKAGGIKTLKPDYCRIASFLSD